MEHAAPQHTAPLLAQPDDILALYARGGHLQYSGEGVTQLQHAWQCGRLAERAQATPALQLAAWLHDLGHLMTGLPGSPTLAGIDDRHESLAAHALAPLFGEAVSRPAALHVQAKRYMVATQPTYAARLSADSLRSLALQGGPMSPSEVAHFNTLPHAADALRLRAWDDAGKLPDWQPGHADQALALLRALMAGLLLPGH